MTASCSPAAAQSIVPVPCDGVRTSILPDPECFPATRVIARLRPMPTTLALEPATALAAAVVFVLFGLLIGRLLLPGPRQVRKLRDELESQRREQAAYKARVNEHFFKTSQLIGQMTESYKAVYDHLATGAQDLCATDTLPGGVFSSPRLIVDSTVDVVTPEQRAAATPTRPTDSTREPAVDPPRAPAPAADGHAEEDDSRAAVSSVPGSDRHQTGEPNGS
jgi:uncharacterized protein